MTKKNFLILFGIIILSFTFLIVKGRNMRTITTEIEIAASPAKVWSIINDINKWQEWSPVINKSSGTAAIGSKLNITMCGKDGTKDGPNYQPTITKLEEAKNLSWTATMMAGFIMTNGKILELEKSNTGTRLVHKETFSGLMSVLMWSYMETGVPPMLNKMNKALKELAEK